MNLIEVLLKAARCRRRLLRKTRGGLHVVRGIYIQHVKRQGRY